MLRPRTLFLAKPLVFDGRAPTISEVPSLATVRIALFESSKNPEDDIGFNQRDREDFQLCAENARACAWALCDEKRTFPGQSARCSDREIVEVLIVMCMKFAFEKKVSQQKRYELDSKLRCLVTWDPAKVTNLLTLAINS